MIVAMGGDAGGRVAMHARIEFPWTVAAGVGRPGAVVAFGVLAERLSDLPLLVGVSA